MEIYSASFLQEHSIGIPFPQVLEGKGENCPGASTNKFHFQQRQIPLKMRPWRRVLFSPWTDLTASGESYTECRDRDPLLTRAYIEAVRGAYTPRGAEVSFPCRIFIRRWGPARPR